MSCSDCHECIHLGCSSITLHRRPHHYTCVMCDTRSKSSVSPSKKNKNCKHPAAGTNKTNRSPSSRGDPGSRRVGSPLSTRSPVSHTSEIATARRENKTKLNSISPSRRKKLVMDVSTESAVINDVACSVDTRPSRARRTGERGRCKKQVTARRAAAKHLGHADPGNAKDAVDDSFERHSRDSRDNRNSSRETRNSSRETRASSRDMHDSSVSSRASVTGKTSSQRGRPAARKLLENSPSRSR